MPRWNLGSLRDRIDARSIPEPNTGCWLWTAELWPSGYALMWWGHQNKRAHRLSYEAFVGPVPEGLVLDHLCRTPSCVNPRHLEPVTCHENLRRSPIHSMNVTHCPHGHEYTPANTFIDRRDKRYCRTCQREQACEYRRRKRGA